MGSYVNEFFETRLQDLLQLAQIVNQAFQAAGLEYRVVGGLATYLYVEEVEPDAGRLTRDIDVVVRREDLERIAKAVEPYGLEHRHVAGLDMLARKDAPSTRRAVHMVFAGEKVRPENAEAVPEMGPSRELRGIRLIPLADLVRMKLTSYRLKDQTHLKDLDEAGLLTPDVEEGLQPLLRERLARVRAQE